MRQIADRFNEVTCCDLSYRRRLNQVVIGTSPTGVFINGQTPVQVRDIAYCPTVGQTVLQANCRRSSLSVRLLYWWHVRPAACVARRSWDRSLSVSCQSDGHICQHPPLPASWTTFHFQLMTPT